MKFDKTHIRDLANLDVENLKQVYPFSPLWASQDVTLDGGKLVWDRDARWIGVKVPSNLLYRYLRLDVGSPKKVLDFCRRWGRLGLCEHDLPSTHSWSSDLLGAAKRAPSKGGMCKTLPTEPVASWQLWIKKFNAVLDVAACLNTGMHGRIEDWRVLFEDTGWAHEEYYLGRGEEENLDLLYGGYWKSKNLSVDKMWLMDVVNNYVDAGRVRPRLQLLGEGYEEIQPRIVHAGEFVSSLFGVLSLQLMTVVGSANLPTICSACGQEYTRERRPKTGQANYCTKSDCQQAARREASRRYRNKPENKKKLARRNRSTS